MTSQLAFDVERRHAGGPTIRAALTEELAPGQVVQVLNTEGAWTRVRAGRELEGRVPAAALLPVGRSR